MSIILKIMPDYDCFPLWIKEGGGHYKNIDPGGLPISEDLKEKLKFFQAKYDQTLNQEYPPNSGFSSEREAVEFDRFGIDLWKQIIKEMGGAYKIEYFSTVLEGIYNDTNQYTTALNNKNLI